MNPSRLFLASFPLLALAACAPPIREPAARQEPPEARVQFTYYGEGILDVGAVVVRFHDGERERLAHGAGFTTQDYGIPHSEVFPTADSGLLRVRVDLVRRDTLASGTLELPFRPDWIWGVAIHLGPDNPLRGCFGCMGYRSFPIRSGDDLPADSLYLVWGGNSISSPVVY